MDKMNRIEATDEKDNTFIKTIKLTKHKRGTVLSLGAPCSWYLSDLQASVHNNDRLYLDAAGRNHKGSPVSCSYKTLMIKVLLLRQPIQRNLNEKHQRLQNRPPRYNTKTA